MNNNMNKLAQEIEKRTENLDKGTHVTVEGLFSAEEWEKIVDLRLSGWLGSKIRQYCDQEDARLEFIGTTKRTTPPRRHVALYRVI